MNAHSNTTAPVVPASELDPVVLLGNRLGDAYRKEEALEGRENETKVAGLLSASIYFEKAATHAADEVDALRQLLAFEQAKSLRGALIQIAAAISRVDLIRDEMPESLKYSALARDFRAVDRLLYSAIVALEGHLQTAVDDLVYEGFGNEHMNPWVPVEDRCDELQEAQK